MITASEIMTLINFVEAQVSMSESAL